jgi:hypothetical protein
MQKTNIPTHASGSLPDDFQEVLNWKVTGKPNRVIYMNVLGIFSFFIFGMFFFGLAASLG